MRRPSNAAGLKSFLRAFFEKSATFSLISEDAVMPPAINASDLLVAALKNEGDYSENIRVFTDELAKQAGH